MRIQRKSIRNMDYDGDLPERLFDIVSDGEKIYLEIKHKNKVIKTSWKYIERQVQDFVKNRI